MKKKNKAKIKSVAKASASTKAEQDMLVPDPVNGRFDVIDELINYITEGAHHEEEKVNRNSDTDNK